MTSRLLDAGYALTVFDTSAEATKPAAARGATVAELPGRGRLRGRDRAHVPADARHRAERRHRRAGRAARLQGAHAHRSVDHGAHRCRHRRARAGNPQHHAGGFAGQRRRCRRQGRNAGGDGVVPEGDLCRGRADPQDLRHACSTPATSRASPRSPSSATTCSPPPPWCVSSEALAMGVKAGIDPQVMIDIINAGSGRNSATQDKFPRSILPGTFDFGFATGLSYKDVRLCVDEAEALGVPMVAGAAVRQMLAVTNAKFGPQSDFTSSPRCVEEWAGVEIRSQRKGEQQGQPAHDGRGLDIGARRAAGASAGPLGAGRHAGGPARRCGIAKAKDCLLDFLACAFEARNLPWSRQAVATARPLAGGASIIASGIEASPADAAFANATLGHGLVREDMHAASICHHGVVIWPALAGARPAHAFAGCCPARGRGGRLRGRRAHRPRADDGRPCAAVSAHGPRRPAGRRRWPGPRCCGSTMAPPPRPSSIAANTSSGLNQWPHTGGSEMYFHPGFAARNAVTRGGARRVRGLCVGEHPRRRGRPVRRLPPRAGAASRSPCSPTAGRKS